VTLKIRPLPQQSVLLACDLADWEQTEKLLASLVHAEGVPAAVELLVGKAWNDDAALGPMRPGAVARLVVGLEGTEAEVAWMREQLAAQWQELGARDMRLVADDAAAELWASLRDFSAQEGAPLVLKASIRPSAVTSFVRLALEIDPQVSIQAHAGSGIVLVRFSQFDAGQVSRSLVARLHPAARAAGGHAVVLSSSGLGELTHQAQWGPADEAVQWMEKVKRQFDPRGLLNPGRFVYSQQ
jgi:FAD/FMN-containing dehydrogenase